jgi:hypothetical protein
MIECFVRSSFIDHAGLSVLFYLSRGLFGCYQASATSRPWYTLSALYISEDERAEEAHARDFQPTIHPTCRRLRARSESEEPRSSLNMFVKMEKQNRASV